MLRRFALVSSVAFLSAIIVSACSSADSADSPAEGASGSGGESAGGSGGSSTGGTGGSSKGGSSGASGKGGSSGSSGASGKGGASGASGTGGAAGDSGAAGASGSAIGTAGIGGQSGAGGSGGTAASCLGTAADCDGDTTNGCESNTFSDAKNCGKCGVLCAAGANQDGVCQSSVCKVQCRAGFTDCDGDATNGCEVATGTDVEHCGSCTAPSCVSGGNGTAACLNGLCGLTCPAGLGNCDGDVSNGCETDIANSQDHCGSCVQTCGTAPCVNGACQCAGSFQSAERLPLDIYVMMDRSGSMTEDTSKMLSKWDAVKAALESFFANAGTGVAVGIQYFPIPDPGVPVVCDPQNDQCGVHGPCEHQTQKYCLSNAGLYACNSDANCKPLGGGTKCVEWGACEKTAGTLCYPIGGTACGGNEACVTNNACTNAECVVADYSAPAVAISDLPAAAPALMASVEAQTPGGGTPTGPALQGAMDYASSWASTHKDHVTVVVLATDGLPSGCTPSDIPGIAQIAATGAAASPSIRTYVIGVFTPADIQAGATTNLDAISQAGMGQTFTVSSGSDVTAEFLAALDTIRKSALGCEYQIPVPANGGTLEYDKVNVVYTPGGTSTPTTLPGVTDLASCPATGGWYYDNASAPTKVLLCPGSCDAVKADATAKLEVELGCQTQKP
jgi:hypothetical protein